MENLMVDLETYNFRTKLKNKFLEKVKEKYNNTYSYPNIDNEYKNKNSYITIVCNKHNYEFKTKPLNHVKNNGCKYCYKDLTSVGKEEFLKRAKEIHGDKYDYSKVDYKTSREKVEIICPVHGSFWQTPYHHTYNKNKCPKCYLDRRRTTGRIILAKPENVMKWMDIIKIKRPNISLAPGAKITGKEIQTKWMCSIHGELNTTLKNILRVGCKYCSRNSNELREIFINKAKKVQGDNVDYSKTDLSEFMPTFICKTHGIEYKQEKRNHIMYIGCPECIKNMHKKSNEDFIKESKLIHGDKYNYDKTNYVNIHHKVTITCPIHGDFDVLAGEHLRKTRKPTGCKYCDIRCLGEKRVLDVLNKNNIKFIYQYKREPYNFRWDFVLPDIKLNIELDEKHHTYLNIISVNDKHKDIIMKKDGYKVVRLPYTSIHKLIETINLIILQNIKYYKDGRCFKTFLDFCRYYNLPPETLPKDVKQYKFVLK